MAWQGIYGHDRIVERFRRALDRGRFASSFLFVGPTGIGKRTFAHKLAQAFLCESPSNHELDPCNRCPACQQVSARTHPDLIVVEKPKDKSFIPVELFIGDREHRMREGLCHDISLKPFRGGRKVAIIDDADYLNQEGANCLLKTLEEPPPNAAIILIGTSEQKQLPTIRSRCQVVRFQPLSPEVVSQILLMQESSETAGEIELGAHGSLAVATTLVEPGIREFRETFLRRIGQVHLNFSDIAKTIMEFVDEAGKDASAKRERMNCAVTFAAEFYRSVMRSLAGLPLPEGNDSLHEAVTAATSSWHGNDETAAACLQRCLETQAHIASNANPTTLIECWLDDLHWISSAKNNICLV